MGAFYFTINTWPIAATVVILVIMAAEAMVSRAHERTLRAQGAIEPRDDVYRTMLWAYPAAFVAMGVEGTLSTGWLESLSIAGLVLMLLAKALKYWAIATLGSRWTFRVLVPPGAPRIRRGPYAVMGHPNYVAVIGELIAFGLMVGAPFLAVVSVVGFGELIRRRIRVEERALRAG